MQDRFLYEYAILRIVPRVEREEFINIGVVVYCSKLKFLKSAVHLNEQKLKSIFADLDIENLRDHVNSFQQICNGEQFAGTIAAMDMPSRFRWLTATRSTILQTSKVHPGFCFDPSTTVDDILKEFVL